MKKNNFAFDIPIKNFKRLIQNDGSDEFFLSIRTDQKDQKSLIDYKMSINQARILSRKINDLYLIDPTIDRYEILMSLVVKNDEIEEILNLLVKSIYQKVEIDQSKKNLFNYIRILLGEEDNTIEFSIPTIEKAVSLLTTEFQLFSIQFLSSHFIEFIESSFYEIVDDEIKYLLIDSYLEKKSNFSEENDQVFEKMKKLSEEKILMHFLSGLKINEMTESMLNYFYDNLDDEIVGIEFCRIIPQIKDHITILIQEAKRKKNIESESVELNESTKKNLIRNCPYLGESNLNGINAFLNKSVNVSATGDAGSDYPISNILKNNQHFFWNIKDTSILNINKSENDSIIEFDVGTSKRIRLFSYLIKSNLNRPNASYHPKSWRIMGSNDRTTWNLLDHRTNDSNLNGPYRQYHYLCQNSEKGDKNNKYRYIRFIQEDNWCDGSSGHDKSPFNILIDYFEMYGDVYSC